MINILYEDNHCLAVDKPAGLLSQGDATGAASLVDLAKSYLKEAYAKPGAVYLGLVHRLDQVVSGVVLLARTSKAAERLSAQFREGSVRKTYWAVVEGEVPDDAGALADVLVKDRARNVVAAVEAGEAVEGVGKAARLAYRVLDRGPGGTWLELAPGTGRGHQIRVQLASRGWPIVGDRKYGARSSVRAEDGGYRIALHARALGFTHPTRRQWLEVTAPAPVAWPGPRTRG